VSDANNSKILDVSASYAGRVVGDGHCVAFVRAVTGLPATRAWRRGEYVRGAENMPKGTAIATFDASGSYGNHTDGRSHAAILIARASDGLLVWDQWKGQPVHQRVIRYRGGQGDPVNDGDAFHVVATADAT
jgi:hypothetical protein